MGSSLMAFRTTSSQSLGKIKEPTASRALRSWFIGARAWVGTEIGKMLGVSHVLGTAGVVRLIDKSGIRLNDRKRRFCWRESDPRSGPQSPARRRLGVLRD